MELKEVDPSLIVVDKMNERQGGTADEEFVENVRATGIIQPPLVRPLDGHGLSEAMGAEYSCVVGGRRVDAATQAELETIPVIVMPWDNAKALLASITENIDAFREDVDIYSRAEAIERLLDMKDWSERDAADGLGVHQTTIQKWREPLKWEAVVETTLTPDDGVDDARHQVQSVEEPSVSTMQKIRRMTGGREANESSAELLQAVREKGLSEVDVTEARKRVDTGQAESPIEAVRQVAEEKEEQREAKTNGEDTVHIRTTFTGDHAKAIKRASEDRSASNDQVVRTAVVKWLESNGYL